jgi:hypothetical protein
LPFCPIELSIKNIESYRAPVHCVHAAGMILVKGGKETDANEQNRRADGVPCFSRDMRWSTFSFDGN